METQDWELSVLLNVGHSESENQMDVKTNFPAVPVDPALITKLVTTPQILPGAEV